MTGARPMPSHQEESGGSSPRDITAGHRAEGREKVTGAARYAYEHPVPDAVYAYPVQAPIASGVIGAVDAAEALAMPGVIAVLGGYNTNSFGGKALNFPSSTGPRSPTGGNWLAS